MRSTPHFTFGSSLWNRSASSVLSIRILGRASFPPCCPSLYDLSPWPPPDLSLLLFPILVAANTARSRQHPLHAPGGVRGVCVIWVTSDNSLLLQEKLLLFYLKKRFCKNIWLNTVGTHLNPLRWGQIGRGLKTKRSLVYCTCICGFWLWKKPDVRPVVVCVFEQEKFSKHEATDRRRFRCSALSSLVFSCFWFCFFVISCTLRVLPFCRNFSDLKHTSSASCAPRPQDELKLSPVVAT